MAIVSLENRVALITGAGRGIGRAIALTLSGCKTRLVLTARTKSDLENTAEDVERTGSEVHTVPADLLNPEEPVRIVRETVEFFGGIDILVNNAGNALSVGLEETTLEQWESVMNLNVRAPFLLTKAALPYLRKSEDPVILNTSSVVGRKGYAYQSVYSASKHALMGMMKAFAREVKEEGILVRAISPGGVATDLVSGIRPDLDTSILITPEEVAEAALFLLTYRGKGAVDELNIRRTSGTPWD